MVQDNLTQKQREDWFRDMSQPEQWAGTAANLWQAADILFREALTDRDGVPFVPENMHMNVPATLLYGYALENAIKGLLIKTRKLNWHDLLSYTKIKQWKQHDLVSLIMDTGIQVSGEEKQLLKTLTAHIVWAGKYRASSPPRARSRPNCSRSTLWPTCGRGDSNWRL